mmetsp:Transcript_46871/g.135073  ORF Transcript_46871/g.135073 Transcript_46871/m.135073 type:complete len:331 (-) Transcript_46871:404-1396(-)
MRAPTFSILGFLIALPLSSAFLPHLKSARWDISPISRTCCDFTSLNLVPLSRLNNEAVFLAEYEKLCIDQNGKLKGQEEFVLGLVEEDEIADLSRFVVAAFGADAIRLSQDINAFERMLMSPAAELLNGYSNIVAFAEVFSGTKQRLTSRLQRMNLSPPMVRGLDPKDAIEVAEKDSLVLAIARPTQGTESKSEIIASIEVRLQPCDAKIPFSLPWLDKVERRLASVIGLGDGSPSDLQPYLSNLCVDEKYRANGIGKALVKCVEDIAQYNWGYNRMYLHVDEDNVPALSLYKRVGYRDVGHRWNPFWAGNAAAIGYYVKSLQIKEPLRN